MAVSKTNHDQGRLFQARLSEQLNLENRFIVLAKKLDWKKLEEDLGCFYIKKGPGQPAKPIRLMVGLLMVQHMEKLSDEGTLRFFQENVYCQAFCGYDYLQKEAPIDATSLIRFRNRIGKAGMDKILAMTVKQAVKHKVIKKKDLQKVVADTTAMPKNIQHPSDARLLDKVRRDIVVLAKKQKIPLRQNYNRLGKKTLLKSGRHGHAKQFKRMQRCIKTLRTYLGRVIRDVERKISTSEELKELFAPLLDSSKKILTQRKDTKNKVYSIHEPHVYCIAKGKARKPYEFGSKVSFITTQNKGLILTANCLEKNDYDGHTLKPSLYNAEKLNEITIREILVDQGYKKHGIIDKKVYMSGQKKGLTYYLKRRLDKRSSVEAHISHMKNDGKLSVNFLKGRKGDEINAVLCAIAHNLRIIINNNYAILKWAIIAFFSYKQMYRFKFPFL